MKSSIKNIALCAKRSYILKNIFTFIWVCIIVIGTIAFYENNFIRESYITSPRFQFLAIAIWFFAVCLGFVILRLFRFDCGKYAHYTYTNKETITPHINISVFFSPEKGVLRNFYFSLAKVTGNNGAPVEIVIYSALCDRAKMQRFGFSESPSSCSVRYLRKPVYCSYCWMGFFWSVFLSPNCKSVRSANKIRKQRLLIASNFDATWKRMGKNKLLVHTAPKVK